MGDRCEPVQCEVYCDRIAAHCNGLYPDRDPDRANCLAACGLFPDGGDEDRIRDVADGNSLACHLYHAAAASDEPQLHCGPASVHGSNVCGGLCEVYCSHVMQTCTGEHALYPDVDACLASCAAMPQDGEFDAAAGNSVQCRSYHGSFPALLGPELHCPHASVNGGRVCGSVCEAYCDQVGVNCADLYEGREQCVLACDDFPPGEWDDVVGDTAACRAYHASFPAAANAALHCPRAAHDGGGVCVP